MIGKILDLSPRGKPLDLWVSGEELLDGQPVGRGGRVTSSCHFGHRVAPVYNNVITILESKVSKYHYPPQHTPVALVRLVLPLVLSLALLRTLSRTLRLIFRCFCHFHILIIVIKIQLCSKTNSKYSNTIDNMFTMFLTWF